MAELKRAIKCSNCGTETNFYLSIDASINELLMHLKCNRCGNSLQINYNLVERGESSQSTSHSSSSDESTTQNVNIDEILYGNQSTTDSLKEIIED